MTKSKIILIIVLSVSLIANLVLSLVIIDKINRDRQRDQAMQSALKALHFRNLFEQNVMMAEGEIDFETRLNLENALSDLNDPEILGLWKDFARSKTRQDASSIAKQLIDLLIERTEF